MQRLHGSNERTSTSHALRSRHSISFPARSTRSETDFRAAILQRLRRPPHFRLSRSSFKASAPSTILEDDDEDASSDSDSDAHPPLSGRSSEPLTAPTETTTSALQSLEAQNRVLHDRLTSQQAVLDQLLESKLQGATAPPTATREYMIKLQDHAIDSRSLCITTHRSDIDPTPVRAVAATASHPLSPSAA